MYAFLKAVHLLAMVVWIGGMFFTHFCLRPAIAQLDAQTRLAVMRVALGRFFSIVLAASALTVGTGGWLMARVAAASARAGGAASMPIEWHVMAALGLLMLAIFLYIRFVPYARMLRMISAADWPAGAAALARIRMLVGVNLALGLAIIAVTQIGVGG